ncbi:long-chain fatty acid--CoA ligase [Halopseudomonas phragmitis]|uniref:Long-chain fatty acid--CoA ligase n=2 Tax=Pseudomonadaceae TaxID=135621 RepID=A0A1V0B729_9GAMM|nr:MULTISPECIES: long-chain fatty acid--CoA ligase [Pseudomonadaceae]AQZ95743.1 long-chain fatty acid--CoA ligase [Halopseudomonas phragmitis]PAU88663.1 long-chain fatty acid--CoA ligase [Pseudomonas sp. WN033]RHW21408.1 long-chain fatty acid--CoA ligase [Pseudomonas jilinensis]
MFDRHYAVWPESVPHFLELPTTSLYSNLSVSALRYPEHPAIIYYGAALSYRELQQQAEALAGYLQQAGVKAGDRVLLYMQNSPQFVIGFYAILRANAVVVPVNPMNRKAELEYLLEDTQAEVALCGLELLENIAPLVGQHGLREVIVSAYSEYAGECDGIDLPEAVQLANEIPELPGLTAWQQALAAKHQPGPLTAGPDDLCVIPYSSGTTGNPKGCVHTHHSVMATTVYCSVWGNAQHDSVQLVSVPMFHVTGMQVCMNCSIYIGGTQVVMTRWDRKAAAQLIQRHGITSWRNISTMVVDLLSDPQIDQYDLSSLKAIGGGGAAMPVAVAEKLKLKTGLEYAEGYGLSETISATHMNPYHAPKPQCLGIPIIGVDSRVVSLETLSEVEPGVTGEIVIHGEQVFQGYWNRPDATAEAFIELDGKRFFRTGDLGYYDEQGYFFLVDRVKRMINASGYKVWPAEVEALLYGHPAVQEVCVISAPDARRGETTKAVIVLAAGQQASAEEIIAWCQGNMSAYKCPKLVEFVSALPKSPTGKILWRALQEQEWAQG